MKKIKILVFTSSRADFSLLKYILLSKHQSIKFHLVISSPTNSKKQMINKVNSENIKIYESIIIKNPSNNNCRLKNINFILQKMGGIFERHKFDFFLGLGDRYETFAAVISANNFQIPIIHLSGGLLSFGSHDEFYRHAITKLATFHFTTSENSRKRVIQMGESPKRVFNYGSLGVEATKKFKFFSKSQIQKRFNFKLNKICILVTVHPNTSDSKIKEVDPILKALKKLNDVSIIFTSPNNDPGFKYIVFKLKKFISMHKNSHYLDKISDEEYLSILKFSNLVLGNSSSGIYQAPYLGVPTLNIGNRQEGRESPKSVINSKISENDIYIKCISILNKNIQVNFKNFPYGKGNTSEKIIKKIASLHRANYIKKFYDLK